MASKGTNHRFKVSQITVSVSHRSCRPPSGSGRLLPLIRRTSWRAIPPTNREAGRPLDEAFSRALDPVATDCRRRASRATVTLAGGKLAHCRSRDGRTAPRKASGGKPHPKDNGVSATEISVAAPA
jgi:hypothetical protein